MCWAGDKFKFGSWLGAAVCVCVCLRLGGVDGVLAGLETYDHIAVSVLQKQLVSSVPLWFQHLPLLHAEDGNYNGLAKEIWDAHDAGLFVQFSQVQ